MNKRYSTVVLFSLLTAGREAPAIETAPPAPYRAVRLEGIPHVRQKPDFCGEACVEMVLRKLGSATTQDDVFDAAGVDPAAGRGCRTAELARALRRLGFAPTDTWHKVPARSTQTIEEQWRRVHEDLLRGVPSIVCMRTGPGRDATEHFRLVLGYDPDTGAMLYHEPAEPHGAYRRMPLGELFACWPLKYAANTWTIIRIPLEPLALRAPARSTGFTDADYAQHVMRLKRKLPCEGWTIVIQRPFVVVGDERPERVRLRAQQTVKWATDRLKRMYFPKDPRDILDIWLFKDRTSYRKHTWAVFRDRPDTPFGYSSSEHKALIMNIATGGGTLVHEIVHPFMEANFPECPAWFNEGLASLYEQSSGRGRRIIGLTNWRLAGLQEAISAGHVPPFRDLLSTTTHQFYNADPGTNYAQARYLCYYLQQKGLLVKYYRQFKGNCRRDPTGYETLKTVLNEQDMQAFEKRWKRFVLGLRFPG